MLSAAGSAEVWGAGRARRLAGSWILSGVQGSLHVRVNGFKVKCAQGHPDYVCFVEGLGGWGCYQPLRSRPEGVGGSWIHFL